MAKVKISRKKAVSNKKIHFLPPSSPSRLPIPLLMLISLSFFILLIGYIMITSLKSKAEKYAFSPEYTTQKINYYGDELIKKVHAEGVFPVSPTPPPPPGYCLTVPILMYHHVQPIAEAEKRGHAPLTVDRDVFESQLAYLNDRKYTTITLNALVQALITHTAVPERSIVLTFDDGYVDMYEYVFPLLKQYNITGNFAIATGLLENTDYMTWNQVKEMGDDSHVTLYNHTWSHSALGQSDKDRIEFEISMSTQDFVNHVGHMSRVFAYPYGSYSDQAIQSLQNHGFSAAVTTEAGKVQCDSYLMKLKRDHVGNVQLSAYGL